MNKTAIQWTELTWNPLRGCSPVSSGCKHCYAKRIADRFGFEWGKVSLIESKLTEPLRRRKPSVIFVNSMSDTFHEAVPDEWIDRMFAWMALCPQHKFLVLTKRAKRMREYFADAKQEPEDIRDRLDAAAGDFGACHANIHEDRWPLPNVGLGVSCEDQERADERIPDLLATPAAMRFVSVEPMLAGVDLFLDAETIACRPALPYCNRSHLLDWVIVGGESGPGARPCHPDWVRSLRDQCVSAGVPYFFKQWGEWLPLSECEIPLLQENMGDKYAHEFAWRAGQRNNKELPISCFRVGKKAAGRMLDGKMWDQRPEGWGNAQAR